MEQLHMVDLPSSVLEEKPNAAASNTSSPIKNSAEDKYHTFTNNKTYRIEDVVESIGFGYFQTRILLICGIISASDALEMMLLSILGPILQCEWNLKSTEIANITTFVFIGFLFGSPFWGFISDRHGRWSTLCIVLVMLSYFGILTSISPTYIWLLFLRFMVGFSIGGASSSFSLLSEYVPSAHRAKSLIGLQFFWALGASLEIGLAYLVVPRLGWRWLIFLSTLPVLSCILFIRWLPESARYLVVAGRREEAKQILEKMSLSAGKGPLKGEFVAPDPEETQMNFKNFFHKNYLRTSLTLPIIWFGAAFTYYGAVLLGSIIFRYHHACYGADSTTTDMDIIKGVSSINATAKLNLDVSCCKALSDDDYVAMIVSSLGEFLILPINIFVVDFIGRRYTMGSWYLLNSVLFCLLYVCMPKVATTVLLFLVRAFASGVFNTIYMYTVEVYPTTMRSLSVGVFSSVSRIGAITTPYIAQVLLPDVSVLAAFLTYAVVCLLCSIACFCLPIETMGRSLPHSVESTELHLREDVKPKSTYEVTKLNNQKQLPGDYVSPPDLNESPL